jgi:hypothetical protein
MAKKCRHKTRVILAFANYVKFTPDEITVESISVHYCPRCKVLQSVETDGVIETE